MDKKEYKTTEEQIEYLIKRKNIDENSIDKSSFNEKTYLSIITPYTDLVAIGRTDDENKEHIYNKNVDFNEYLSWNKIDKYMSFFLHAAIGIFEKKLKLFLERKICGWMYANGDKSCCDYTGWQHYLGNYPYLEFMNIYEIETNFNVFTFAKDSIKNSRRTAIESILKINAGEIRATELVKHYRSKNYLPFWVAIHELTINELFQLFSMIKYVDKKEFVAEILNIELKKISFNDVKKFESKIAYITDIRNRINHYEPIIPLIIKVRPDLYNIIYSSIKILCALYKRTNNINICIIKPEIITIKNEYNKSSYDRITNIVELIENNL